MGEEDASSSHKFVIIEARGSSWLYSDGYAPHLQIDLQREPNAKSSFIQHLKALQSFSLFIEIDHNYKNYFLKTFFVRIEDYTTEGFLFIKDMNPEH